MLSTWYKSLSALIVCVVLVASDWYVPLSIHPVHGIKSYASPSIQCLSRQNNTCHCVNSVSGIEMICVTLWKVGISAIKFIYTTPYIVVHGIKMLCVAQSARFCSIRMCGTIFKECLWQNICTTVEMVSILSKCYDHLKMILTIKQYLSLSRRYQWNQNDGVTIKMVIVVSRLYVSLALLCQWHQNYKYMYFCQYQNVMCHCLYSCLWHQNIYAIECYANVAMWKVQTISCFNVI